MPSSGPYEHCIHAQIFLHGETHKYLIKNNKINFKQKKKIGERVGKTFFLEKIHLTKEHWTFSIIQKGSSKLLQAIASVRWQLSKQSRKRTLWLSRFTCLGGIRPWFSPPTAKIIRKYQTITPQIDGYREKRILVSFWWQCTLLQSY